MTSSSLNPAFVLFLLVGGSQEPAPKEQDVAKLLESGRAAVRAKDCARAIASFQAVLDQSQAKPLDKERRGAIQQEALKNIADCKAEAGDLDGAETALWRRREILLDWRGPQAIELGHNFLDLAFVQIKRERWPQAERYARDGLAIYDQALTQRGPPGKRPIKSGEVSTTDINRSKVTGLYILGLALALQRRTSEALKTWEEGYLLGEPLEPKPKELLQIAIQAIDLHDMMKIRDGRPIWVERLRKLRSP